MQVQQGIGTLFFDEGIDLFQRTVAIPERCLETGAPRTAPTGMTAPVGETEIQRFPGGGEKFRGLVRIDIVSGIDGIKMGHVAVVGSDFFKGLFPFQQSAVFPDLEGRQFCFQVRPDFPVCLIHTQFFGGGDHVGEQFVAQFHVDRGVFAEGDAIFFGALVLIFRRLGGGEDSGPILPEEDEVFQKLRTFLEEGITRRAEIFQILRVFVLCVIVLCHPEDHTAPDPPGRTAVCGTAFRVKRPGPPDPPAAEHPFCGIASAFHGMIQKETEHGFVSGREPQRQRWPVIHLQVDVQVQVGRPRRGGICVPFSLQIQRVIPGADARKVKMPRVVQCEDRIIFFAAVDFNGGDLFLHHVVCDRTVFFQQRIVAGRLELGFRKSVLRRETTADIQFKGQVFRLFKDEGIPFRQTGLGEAHDQAEIDTAGQHGLQDQRIVAVVHFCPGERCRDCTGLTGNDPACKQIGHRVAEIFPVQIAGGDGNDALLQIQCPFVRGGGIHRTELESQTTRRLVGVHFVAGNTGPHLGGPEFLHQVFHCLVGLTGGEETAQFRQVLCGVRADLIVKLVRPEPFVVQVEIIRCGIIRRNGTGESAGADGKTLDPFRCGKIPLDHAIDICHKKILSFRLNTKI